MLVKGGPDGHNNYRTSFTYVSSNTPLILFDEVVWINKFMHLFILYHSSSLKLSSCILSHSFSLKLSSWLSVLLQQVVVTNIPDNKFHGDNMGHTWIISAPGRPHFGPINRAIMWYYLTILTCHRWDSKDRMAVNLAVQWRHNVYGSVSNYQPRGCLLNRLFRRRSKKTSKLRVTGLCAGNSPGSVNSPTKGQLRGLCFHLMTSSWNKNTNLSFMDFMCIPGQRHRHVEWYTHNQINHYQNCSISATYVCILCLATGLLLLCQWQSVCK